MALTSKELANAVGEYLTEREKDLRATGGHECLARNLRAAYRCLMKQIGYDAKAEREKATQAAAPIHLALSKLTEEERTLLRRYGIPDE